ncbi:MAG: hypothetical protein QM702_10455 [Rubrivivax sp.]
MAVTLNGPIAWKTATGDNLAMLEALQPNIIKPHVREFLTLLFLKFDNAAAGRAFLTDLATVMKSTRAHLIEVRDFKEKQVPGTPYIGVGLTATGYQALGVPAVPADKSFQGGMQGTAGLNDPAVGDWEEHFRAAAQLHAVVLVGDMLKRPRDAALKQVEAKIAAAGGVTVLARQEGVGQHNANNQGIEHFGYVDGRSQPLFLDEDIADETNTTDGTSLWNPEFPLGQVIVRDAAAPDPNVHFGSYFIFRKLEQNVKLFKARELQAAEDLGIDDEERAGGMLVGRFEDGTPVTMQFAEGAQHPVPNNFTYDSDKAGAKCPFLGHVRKTNPRGSGGEEKPEDERKHLMARRGQTSWCAHRQSQRRGDCQQARGRRGAALHGVQQRHRQPVRIYPEVLGQQPGISRGPERPGSWIGPHHRPDAERCDPAEHDHAEDLGQRGLHGHRRPRAAHGDDEGRRVFLHAVAAVPAEPRQVLSRIGARFCGVVPRCLPWLAGLPNLWLAAPTWRSPP